MTIAILICRCTLYSKRMDDVYIVMKRLRSSRARRESMTNRQPYANDWKKTNCHAGRAQTNLFLVFFLIVNISRQLAAPSRSIRVSHYYYYMAYLPSATANAPEGRDNANALAFEYNFSQFGVRRLLRCV